MRSFGISQTQKTKRYKNTPISTVFSIVLVVSFLLFLFRNNINTFLFQKNKIDIFKEDLNTIALYTLPIDKGVSTFLLKLDELVKGYNKGENILISKEAQISYVRNFIKTNKTKLKNLGFSNYETLFNLGAELRSEKDELFGLLGKNKSYNYLIILQNTNEKRPNGGFFGSFAFVTMNQGHIENLEIVDAYYPDFIAYNTRIIAPERTKAFLPDQKIGFIAGNKFGFTNIDGANLKQLYEKMFNKDYDMKKVQQTMQPELYNKLLNKDIKGVVFIRSDMIEKAIPGFQKKIRERQFVNASIDILRGEVKGNKKEKYIKEVKAFFSENKGAILKNLINNFASITNQQAINIYLSHTSPKITNILQKYKLSNAFSTGSIYARDTNVSYDKVDGFVSKTITITNSQSKESKSIDGDIIDIKQLKPGKYKMTIEYTLNIPDEYKDFIGSLERKYDIKMTDREKGILALQASVYDDPKRGKVTKRRESKSTIYVPKNISFENIEGDAFYNAKFTAPFANGLFYQIGITKNMTRKHISCDLIIQ